MLANTREVSTATSTWQLTLTCNLSVFQQAKRALPQKTPRSRAHLVFSVLCYLAAGLINEPASSGVPGHFLSKCYYKVRQSNKTPSTHPKHYSPTHRWLVTAEPKTEGATLESDRFLIGTQVRAQKGENNIICVPSPLAESS